MDIPVGLRLSQDEWLARNTLPFVFPYLNSTDLSKAALVCKLWQEIAFEPRLWRHAEFKNNRIRINLMADFLSAQKTVKLTLVDCIFANKDPDFLLEQLHKISSLRALELSKFRTKFIHRLPEINSNLQELSVKLIDAHFTKLNLKFLEKLPHLQSLTLDCSGREIINILYLKYLRNLKHLSLKVGNLQILNLDELNYNLCQLETLELGNTPNRSFYSNFILHLCKLRTLKLDRPEFLKVQALIHTNRGYHNIDVQKIMKQLTTLKKLELIDCDDGYDKVMFCENLREVVIVPNRLRGMCRDMVLLNDSNITSYRLGIRSELFGKIVKTFSFIRSTETDILDLVSDYFGLRETTRKEGRKILIDTIYQGNFDKFLNELQVVISELLPKIKVSVIDYHDKWSSCNWECKKYRSKQL